MEIRVRLADDADEPAVCRLDALASAGDLNRAEAIHAAIENRRCLVAEQSGVTGYVVVARRQFFGRDFVELLVVGHAARRRGVGRALLRAAVEHADTARVFSSTNESNDAMKALFAADGWTLSGRLDGLDPGDPELVYFIDRPS